MTFLTYTVSFKIIQTGTFLNCDFKFTCIFSFQWESGYHLLPSDFDDLPYPDRGYDHTFIFQNDRKPRIG